MNNNRQIPIASNYEVWREQFFRSRLALAYKFSIFFFGISSIFSWLLIYFGRSNNIWELRRNVLMLLLCGVGLFAINNTQKKNQLNFLFLCLIWLLLFSENLETSSNGISLNIELSIDVFLIQAVIIPAKFGLHLIGQVSVVSAYLLAKHFTTQPTDNPYFSDLTITILELLDLFWTCFACDFTVFLQEKLRKSELKTRQELQLFVRNISQKLRQPLLANLQRLRQILNHSDNSIIIARSDLNKMLHRSDRQLTLIQSMLEQANYTQTDYQVWRSHFIKQRLFWFLVICLSYCVTLMVMLVYIIIIGVKSPVKEAILSYFLAFALVIACLVIVYKLSKTKLFEFHFAWFFIGIILVGCLLLQISEILSGYTKPAVSTWSIIFLLCATLFPLYWRSHLIAQISVIISYLAIITVFSINVPMSTVEIFAEIWFLFCACLICNLTVYTLEQLHQREYESRQQMQLFLYPVAHDLKTPVLGLLMFLENLLSQPQNTFDLPHSQINKMIQASDRQLHLLDSLLEVHHRESVGITCDCQPTQLNHLVETLIDEFEPILTKNEASITNLVSDNLPNISADSMQLRRVYENLIINAIKHNPPGVEIILKATLEKNMLRCTVEDNGVGIDPTRHNHIFSLYSGDSPQYGSASRVRRSPGLGLGLYLCRQIITAHQGKIGVDSFPSKGTTFWFTIPIAVK
jgi:signal transduction histidine kinase